MNIKLTLVCVFSMLFSAVMLQASWTFEEINYSPGGAWDDDYVYRISWRPQGDYALIAACDGLYRYNYEEETLEYLDIGSRKARDVQFSRDGTFALISNLTEIYRYDHAESGFGEITTITDIQYSGTQEIRFYDVVFNPAPRDNLAYITANRQSTSGQHQLTIYRYDPDASPQIYPDYTGGTTYAMNDAFGGMRASFQPDGDYFVITNKFANGYSEGIFVYDPDQSTFPKLPAGAMQWFPRNTYLGNSNAVTMGRASGQRFVLVRGNGRTQRTIQTGVPASFNNWDQPSPSPDMAVYSGDADYSYDGMLGIVVERAAWTPYHRIGTFDHNGDASGGVDLVGLPEQRPLRINAVAWHPNFHMGLMGGEKRWLIRFSTTAIPTPEPTATPVPTATATPEPPDCINHGDVNQDGLITSADAQLAFFIVLGQFIPTHEQWCAADCNADGQVTAADAQQIFQTVLGQSECQDSVGFR